MFVQFDAYFTIQMCTHNRSGNETIPHSRDTRTHNILFNCICWLINISSDMPIVRANWIIPEANASIDGRTRSHTHSVAISISHRFHCLSPTFEVECYWLLAGNFVPILRVFVGIRFWFSVQIKKKKITEFVTNLQKCDPNAITIDFVFWQKSVSSTSVWFTMSSRHICNWIRRIAVNNSDDMHNRQAHTRTLNYISSAALSRIAQRRYERI